MAISRTRIAGTSAGRPSLGGRPASAWAFAGAAITSFGGPLALAALYAPGVLAATSGAGSSAGLAMVGGVVVFTFPLAIWLRYARQVNGPGGLYSFTEAAAGRRVALVQAGSGPPSSSPPADLDNHESYRRTPKVNLDRTDTLIAATAIVLLARSRVQSDPSRAGDRM